MVVDSQGFRENVGIVLINQADQVFWARRARQKGWQFPQGGTQPGEELIQSVYRELYEEVGLKPEHVDVLDQSPAWLYYHLPQTLIRQNQQPLVVGQKQKWFLLRLVGDVANIRLDASDKPEFDQWRWVEFWHPLNEVVSFKREVYQQVLTQFANTLNLERT